MSQDELKAKGNDAFKAKRYPEAIDWYTKAIAVNPDVEAAGALYSNRAASHTGLQNYEAAIKDAEECIRVRPSWLKGHFRKGTALEALNRLDEAARAFDDALKTEPHNEEVQEKLTAIRTAVRERNEKMKPVHCKTPADAKAIGNSLFSTGKYEQASEFYGRAIELASVVPTSADDKAAFHANRAACRQQVHDYQGVIADANAALEIVPMHLKALLRRAIAYEGLEKWQKALDDFNAVNRMSPGMSNVSQGVVRCQRALRN